MNDRESETHVIGDYVFTILRTAGCVTYGCIALNDFISYTCVTYHVNGKTYRNIMGGAT